MHCNYVLRVCRVAILGIIAQSVQDIKTLSHAHRMKLLSTLADEHRLRDCGVYFMQDV